MILAPRMIARVKLTLFQATVTLLLVASVSATADADPSCKAELGRRAELVRGEVTTGEAFSQITSAGWLLRLLPVTDEWLLQVTTKDRPKEDLARLTPPFHFAPNPRDIEGWHFRNAENTGPNDGTVNAPQELREFIFSPRVGRDIQGDDAQARPSVDDLNQVRAFGRGWFYIESYRLTPVRRGERARFEWLRFSACLTWPSDKRSGGAQTVAEAPSAPTIPKLPDVNPEIVRLVAEDQWDRGVDMFGGRQVKQAESLDWSAIARRDAERQTSIKALLAKGELKTGRDYHYAALILQHSETLEHLRLAHVLATTAVAIGHTGARWLSAATLDRYLLTSGQPQIFGTQFRRSTDDAPWTMEPYDRQALSDSIRSQWCVVPLAEQQAILDALRSEGPMRPTSVADCR